ncbi:MAG: helix-turn-helix transcriptional regulator [Ruminococcaceae bacterium]|nr:helix-turn-helix transcriptional regulator [Oscillospiraceae bacterium]
MVYRIKEIREERKMTQEELAKASGVSRATIAALENHTARTTTTKTLLKLANALGTTVDAIFFTPNV